eukprot:3944991-Pyramimonas_sp.AAC.1
MLEQPICGAKHKLRARSDNVIADMWRPTVRYVVKNDVIGVRGPNGHSISLGVWLKRGSAVRIVVGLLLR